MFFWGHSNLPNIQNHPKSFKDDLPTTHITAATLSHKDLTLSFTVLLIGTKKRMGEVLRSSRKRGNVVLVQSGSFQPKTTNNLARKPTSVPTKSPYCHHFIGGNPSKETIFLGRASKPSPNSPKATTFSPQLGGIMQARGQDPRLCTYISYMFPTTNFTVWIILDCLASNHTLTNV